MLAQAPHVLIQVTSVCPSQVVVVHASKNARVPVKPQQTAPQDKHVKAGRVQEQHVVIMVLVRASQDSLIRSVSEVERESSANTPGSSPPLDIPHPFTLA